jgi:serine protease inhibitor
MTLASDMFPAHWSRPVALVATFVLVGACAGSTDPGSPEAVLTQLPRSLSVAEQKVLGASNEFTFALFRRLSDAQRGANVFVSPLSASMALGMTMNGAAGTTFDEMRSALAFGGASQEEINQGYASLIDLLHGLDRSVTFEIANSVWYRQNFSFHQSFFDAVRGPFAAEVRGLDFASPTALPTINGWVSDRTHGKIPTILQEIRRDDVMYLINAIYFNGNWRARFDPTKTESAQFHTADGASQPASLMHAQRVMRYLETPQLQAIDLPYGRDAFTMTVLLPKEGTDIESLAATLDGPRWREWAEQFREHEVNLYLPKLKLSYERSLIDDLKSLGMHQAFVEGGADFTRMSPAGRDLFISIVKQKTYVDIHEEGTEAAAVTVVGISLTSAPVVSTMRVDRPYLVAIRERLSGTILFIGKIVAMPGN